MGLDVRVVLDGGVDDAAVEGAQGFEFHDVAPAADFLGGFLGLLHEGGALLGAGLLLGFDNVVSPLLTRLLQTALGGESTHVMASFSNWRWIVFGTALVVMMRLRPEGLWPSSRVAEELHEAKEDVP